MKSAVPKQYLTVGGRPLISHSIDVFASSPRIDGLVVVVAPSDLRIEELVEQANPDSRVTVVREGGATRADSVFNGLAALAGIAYDDDWVLVHDAARCGITSELLDRLIDAVGDDPVGGLLALPVDDTLKREDATGADVRSGIATVATTVDRGGLWRAQTPQMFRYRMLVDALVSAQATGIAVTDESSAVEALGRRVMLVRGSPSNFKVTTPDDLAMMELLLRDR